MAQATISKSRLKKFCPNIQLKGKSVKLDDLKDEEFETTLSVDGIKEIGKKIKSFQIWITGEKAWADCVITAN